MVVPLRPWPAKYFLPQSLPWQLIGYIWWFPNPWLYYSPPPYTSPSIYAICHKTPPKTSRNNCRLPTFRRSYAEQLQIGQCWARAVNCESPSSVFNTLPYPAQGSWIGWGKINTGVRFFTRATLGYPGQVKMITSFYMAITLSLHFSPMLIELTTDQARDPGGRLDTDTYMTIIWPDLEIPEGQCRKFGAGQKLFSFACA